MIYEFSHPGVSNPRAHLCPTSVPGAPLRVEGKELAP